MHKLISWYNRNRKKIRYGIVLLIIMWILSTKILDGLGQNNNRIAINKEPTSKINDGLNSIKIESEESVLTGNKVEVKKEEVSIIDEFISYCNSQNIQGAYNLLSADCKSELYPSVNDFQQNYYRKLFGGATKTVKAEIWTKDIYKIDIKADALATGKYTGSTNTRDYISVVKDEMGIPKLNIGGFIKREYINKSLTTNNIEISLVKKDSYMDYEYYTIEVKNYTNKTISIADIHDENSIYLLDKNNMKYTAYLNEYTQEQLNINAKSVKTIKLKFFNTYNSTRVITNVVLPKIITDSSMYYVSNDPKHIQKLKFEL